jgi:hypothetical protein
MALTTIKPSLSCLPNSETVEALSPELYTYLTSHSFYARLLGPINDDLRNKNSKIQDAIGHCSLYICTDGSYNLLTSKCTCGRVIASNHSNLWCGAGPSKGHSAPMTPYQVLRRHHRISNAGCRPSGGQAKAKRNAHRGFYSMGQRIPYRNMIHEEPLIKIICKETSANWIDGLTCPDMFCVFIFSTSLACCKFLFFLMD